MAVLMTLETGVAAALKQETDATARAWWWHRCRRKLNSGGGLEMAADQELMLARGRRWPDT